MRQPTRKGKPAVTKAAAAPTQAAGTRTPGRQTRQRIPLRQMVSNLEKAKGKDKVELLKQYASPAFKQYLGYIYDPRVAFTTLGDLPPYVPLDPTDAKVEKVDDAVWELLSKTPAGGFPPVYYLTDHGKGNFTHEALQLKVKSMLERIHPDDAIVLEGMFYKEVTAGITRKMLEEVWPKWTSEWPD